MRISSKCSLALHILVVLEVFKGRKLTSELLARSTGCNPVMVRNIMTGLKKAGIIAVRRGTGGAELIAEPKDITILSVYRAVDPSSLEELIGLHPHPYSGCPVGRNIYSLLKKPYHEIALAVERSMSEQTLEQIINEYNELPEL